jgi:hypothetical protein
MPRKTGGDGSGDGRDRLEKLHRELTTTARKLMVAKNRDYGADSDPFRNFHQFGYLGILVRLSDKLARLRTYTERKSFAVKSESVTDTVIDVINYAVLFEGYRRSNVDRGAGSDGDTSGHSKARRIPKEPSPGTPAPLGGGGGSRKGA